MEAFPTDQTLGCASAPTSWDGLVSYFQRKESAEIRDWGSKIQAGGFSSLCFWALDLSPPGAWVAGKYSHLEGPVAFISETKAPRQDMVRVNT